MFGYVRPSMPKLSKAEQERFGSAYCGLCHALGNRYGFCARMILNYDFTLLAILLSEKKDAQESRCRRCVAHPFHRRCAMEGNDALALAADESVILAWWQLRDGIRDHGFFGGLKYRFVSLFLRRAYKKAARLRPAFDDVVRTQLSHLSTLEKSGCASIDAAADAFAVLLQASAGAITDPVRRRILEQIFYHLGRWVYLVDAVDDFKRDFRHGDYNPLRLRYRLSGAELPPSVKREIAVTLDHSIHMMSSALELWDFGEWKPILDSIFYEGLYAVGKAVLDGTFRRGSGKYRKTDKEETV